MTNENLSLDENKILQLKKILLEQKEDIQNSYSAIKDLAISSDETSDVVDSATSSSLHSDGFRFLNRRTSYLKKINNSLLKIKLGEFGICEECDGEISYRRLLARPTATLCIDCKEDSEHQEISRHKVSQSYGKSIAEI
ncbi:TraR/DksA family transcriptional regulator [Bacteriovorax sp. DB6_IX]|uniref:TraR/DksA family transcriptional regulator n=1 Tax=Bacteriovorax sp. DB6_IX TaxID=1353530 RepID=UPI00038A3E17|nr:TraR/DksA family transcriptional regulator [Bacteriovorax sp. DB6_IX]EQC52451.1 putative RNA polymerase-binding protein DksA [Bacteriovorax sp. DB6_IX]